MGKRKKKSSSTQERTPTHSTFLKDAIAQAQAQDMLEQGRPGEAVDLLVPLTDRHPNDANLHKALGLAYADSGQLWEAISHYEKALSLGRDASLLLSLGILYHRLDLKILALRAFRQAQKSRQYEPLLENLPVKIARLEDEILALAFTMNIHPETLAKGFGYMEEGQIALQNADYARCIQLNRRAIRFLGDFPPVLNNLSLALFFHGEPEQAIQTAQQVLALDPDNIHAHGNLIRFTAWTGKTEQARQIWRHFKQITPHDYTTKQKLIEAAAIMEDDEEIYRMLKEKEKEGDHGVRLSSREKIYLAIAEANTNRHMAAKRRLKQLQKNYPWADQILNAIEAGNPGLGWADRFSYIQFSDFLPQREMGALLQSLERKGKMSSPKLRREVDRFVARYPQLILVGKKILIEEQQVDAGIGLLRNLGTPEAFSILREFGLSQTGDDKSRMQALLALSEEDQLPIDEPIRIWRDGQWQEIQLRKHKITEAKEMNYAPKVIRLIDAALEDFQANRFAKAEEKYKRVLTLEPNAKEAYNNLAVIYSREDKFEQAWEMMQKAIELDPLYVMPRCNMALFLLDEDKLDEAQAMIDPLIDVLQLSSQEMAFLSYVRARIHIEKREFDQARNILEFALQVFPDYKLVQDLLNNLKVYEAMSTGFSGFFERQRERALSKRKREQTLLSTTDPTLFEALGIYTKENLTAIARFVIPWGGWTSLKKAELHKLLVDYLVKKESLEQVLDSLTPEERSAFEYVRESGGYMPWETFDEKYGNDLEQSPYWNYRKPETVMGNLRAHGLLVEATVEGMLMVCIPVELRM